jgi:hypothetical protein
MEWGRVTLSPQRTCSKPSPWLLSPRMMLAAAGDNGFSAGDGAGFRDRGDTSFSTRASGLIASFEEAGGGEARIPAIHFPSRTHWTSNAASAANAKDVQSRTLRERLALSGTDAMGSGVKSEKNSGGWIWGNRRIACGEGAGAQIKLQVPKQTGGGVRGSFFGRDKMQMRNTQNRFCQVGGRGGALLT